MPYRVFKGSLSLITTVADNGDPFCTGVHLSLSLLRNHEAMKLISIIASIIDVNEFTIGIGSNGTAT